MISGQNTGWPNWMNFTRTAKIEQENTGHGMFLNWFFASLNIGALWLLSLWPNGSKNILPHLTDTVLWNSTGHCTSDCLFSWIQTRLPNSIKRRRLRRGLHLEKCFALLCWIWSDRVVVYDNSVGSCFDQKVSWTCGWFERPLWIWLFWGSSFLGPVNRLFWELWIQWWCIQNMQKSRSRCDSFTRK